VRETQEWKALPGGEGKDYPRRAGVSSFGFGGANAHVVIEEYIPSEQPREQIDITPQNPAIIVLSAKNEKRLKDHAKQLVAAIKEKDISDINLADMAYTLQVGREGMEERLGLIAGSIKEVEEKLQRFVAGEEGIDDLYRGQVKRNKDTLSVFAADEDMAKTIEAWIAKGKYTKLLDLWVKGLIFDWNKLYSDHKPRRISLPSYPFAKERYWLPKSEQHMKTPLLSIQNNIPFDERFYEQLLDDVIDSSLSVDAAVQKTASLYLKLQNKRRTSVFG